MCAQQRLRSVWASAQSDQSFCCPHKESLGPQLPIEHTSKTLIRLGCPGWSESSLGAQVILLFLSCGGWNFFSQLQIQQNSMELAAAIKELEASTAALNYNYDTESQASQSSLQCSSGYGTMNSTPATSADTIASGGRVFYLVVVCHWSASLLHNKICVVEIDHPSKCMHVN